MKFLKWTTALFSILTLALSGCGGGGGSSPPLPQTNNDQQAVTTVSGVAAAGAPLTGVVYLRDSTGAELGPVAMSATGDFSFDVTGLTPPFLIEAEGKAGTSNYRLHSVATAPGTANVNPLTEMAASAALGADPAVVFNDPAAHAAALEPLALEAAMDQAIADIKQMLQPLLDSFEANFVNPFTDAYVADSTGLDAIFDVVTIEVNNTTGAASVVDRASGTTIAAADIVPGGGMTVTDVVDTTETTAVVTAKSNLDQIAGMFGTFMTSWKNVGAGYFSDTINATEAAAQLDQFFVPAEAFGHMNGRDRTLDIQEWVEDSDFTATVTGVRNFSIVETKGAAYYISMVFDRTDGSVEFPDEPLVVTNRGTAELPDWRFTGNGKLSDVWVSPMAQRYIWPEAATTVNGLRIDIDDPTLAFATGTVKGPGLPAEGLSYTKSDAFIAHLNLNTNSQACARVIASNCDWRAWNTFGMDDTTIATIPDNAVYTFELFDAAGAPVETREVTTGKRPWMTGELTDNHFTSLPDISSHDLQWAETNLIGQTTTQNFVLPSALTKRSADIDFVFWTTDNNTPNSPWIHSEVNQEVMSTATSTALAVPAPPLNSTLQEAYIGGWNEDIFGRGTFAHWFFEPGGGGAPVPAALPFATDLTGQSFYNIYHDDGMLPPAWVIETIAFNGQNFTLTNQDLTSETGTYQVTNGILNLQGLTGEVDFIKQLSIDQTLGATLTCWDVAQNSTFNCTGLGLEYFFQDEQAALDFRDSQNAPLAFTDALLNGKTYYAEPWTNQAGALIKEKMVFTASIANTYSVLFTDTIDGVSQPPATIPATLKTDGTLEMDFLDGESSIFTIQSVGANDTLTLSVVDYLNGTQAGTWTDAWFTTQQ